MLSKMEPDDQCSAMLVWVQIDTTSLPKHLNQSFKMFIPFIPLLGIYPKEIIYCVGKYSNIIKNKNIGIRIHLK